MTSNNKAPESAYDQTRQIMQQTAKTGLLTPLIHMLNNLLEDPVLKDTLQSTPANSAPLDNKNN